MSALKPEFDHIIQRLREPLLLTTPAGEILSVNPAGADALGTSVALLAGVDISVFAVEPATARARLKAALRGVAEPFVFQSRDGRRFSCEASALDLDTMLLRLSGGPDSEGRARTLVEARARLQAVTEGPEVGVQALARLERLHAFTGALAQAITPSHVVEVVVDLGLSACEAEAGGFWQVSADGASVRMLRGVGSDVPRSELLGDLPLAVAGKMPILDAIRSSAPIWIESGRQMEERYAAFHAQMASKGPCDKALACLPLLAQGRCIGGLTYRFAASHAFAADERAFLQLLSWYAAQAFERAHLYASEKGAREAAVASQRRAEFLANAGNILMSSLDYQSTLASLAQAAVPSVADWCVVELTGTGATSTTPPVAAHADPSKVGAILELRERHRKAGVWFGIDAVRLSGASLHHREITRSMIEQAIPDDAEYLRLCDQVGVASAMVVPIVARGRILGTILLVSARPARLYDEEDLAMAEELARRAGIAVDNALLYSAARDADLRKDEFLAMLGHELRNPLAPIRTALELMTLKGSTAFQHERTIIGRQVEHLVGLVDDLLDVSRITRGKIELRKAHVDVAAIVADAVEMASPALERRAHQLVVVPGSGLTVLADPARMSQAIANLLTNAAKFTEPGGRIDVSATREVDTVVIRVKDSGIGIAEDMLSRIFDPFFQSAGARERSQGGLGLGLTIVASLVELHGGTVTAHSDGIGKGSEFVIRLALAAQSTLDAQHSAEPPNTAATAAPALRVLVVDDNYDAAAVLSDVLRWLGCTVQMASDGPSALAVLSGFQPELALLDIGMPVMDGYELARRMRALDVTAGAYLVAITGYGQENDRRRALEAGFDDHIVKPVDLERIRVLVEHCNERARNSARGTPQN